jgi:hypothetical protein
MTFNNKIGQEYAGTGMGFQPPMLQKDNSCPVMKGLQEDLDPLTENGWEKTVKKDDDGFSNISYMKEVDGKEYEFAIRETDETPEIERSIDGEVIEDPFSKESLEFAKQLHEDGAVSGRMYPVSPDNSSGDSIIGGALPPTHPPFNIDIDNTLPPNHPPFNIDIDNTLPPSHPPFNIDTDNTLKKTIPGGLGPVIGALDKTV